MLKDEGPLSFADDDGDLRGERDGLLSALNASVDGTPAALGMPPLPPHGRS